MLALGEGRLAEHLRERPLRFSSRVYVDVALCAQGYPAAPRTGDVIEGLDALPEGVYAFHAGTHRVGTSFVTAGGRVVHIVAGGDIVAEARSRAYEGAARVTFRGKHHRSDIAAEAAPAAPAAAAGSR